MHPTIDEQLQGARRLLENVAADGGLSASSAGALVEAQRILRQVEASWSRLLPFYTKDNATLSALLERLASLPVDIDVTSAAVASASGLEVSEAAAYSAELRQQLSRAIVLLPETDIGSQARAEIFAYLRDRVDHDPGG